jgi:thymidylate synthase (FAD)
LITVEIKNITEKPLKVQGGIAGECYNSKDPQRFQSIAKRCLNEGHGKISEYPDITLSITANSRLIRQLYTHCVGVSKIQQSTRYIDCVDFEAEVPKGIDTVEKAMAYRECLDNIKETMRNLKRLGVHHEEYATLLPINYISTTVVKLNLRALIHMFNERSCSCAMYEFRELMKEIKKQILSLGCEEWTWIAEKFFVPKCEVHGSCLEVTRHCGRKPTKKQLEEVWNQYGKK